MKSGSQLSARGFVARIRGGNEHKSHVVSQRGLVLLLMYHPSWYTLEPEGSPELDNTLAK